MWKYCSNDKSHQRMQKIAPNKRDNIKNKIAKEMNIPTPKFTPTSLLAEKLHYKKF